MKKLVRLLSVGLVVCSVFASACVLKEEDNITSEIAEYKSPAESFSLTLAELNNGWAVANMNNDYSLVLDDENERFTIMIQGIPGAGIDTLEDFIIYNKQFVDIDNAENFEVVEKTEVDVPVSNYIIDIESHEYITKDNNDTVIKTIDGYFETESSYYSYTITGFAEEYDKYIDTYSSILQSFKEYSPVL